METELITCPVCGKRARTVTVFSKEGRTTCMHMVRPPVVRHYPEARMIIPVLNPEKVAAMAADGRFDEVLKQCRTYCKTRSRV